MVTRTISSTTSLSKIGWFSLLISTGLMAVGHFFMIFIFDEPVLFTNFTAFQLLAFFVLYIPFRRQEKWAWVISWMLPLSSVVIAISDPELTLYFVAFTAICVAGLLVTMGDFFSRSQ